jgi:peptidoglycan/LPS O-acetylase OafA/YrhL
MSRSSVAAAPADGAAASRAPSSRVVSIDILRGLAILWVITFHLWADMTYELYDGATPLYEHVRDHALDGKFLAMLTSIGEVILEHGYMGVAVFMMLSGLSLTMNAHRRGEPGMLRGYAVRFRRILPVYWGGVLLLVATVAVIALLQQWLDGGSYQHQWFNVRIGLFSRVGVVWQDVAWALSVGAWVFRDKQDTFPVGSLWFVELLLQYYLIFPFAYIALKKIGPWYFALAGIAVTLAFRAAYVPLSHPWDTLYSSRYLWALAPLRASEFFIGMSMGHLIATRREQVAEWFRSPIDTAGLVVLGVLLVMTAALITPQGDPQLIFGDVILHLGLACLILPLVFKAPGRLEVSVVARPLVFLGVISFTALIVNDMMRYVGSFLRYEDVTGPPWWFFLWVVYVPVGTLLAYPLAKVFGLLPSQRTNVAAAAPVAEPVYRTRRERKRAAARAREAARRPARV